MTEPRIIKKYPNRRLYDTAISSYITLEDVRKLVLENVEVKVIDARTKEDITHSTLLQIIIDQEENGPPIFSTDLLQQMIRFYGSSMQNVISSLFEQSTQFFQKQQELLKQGFTTSMHGREKDPFSVMTDFAKNNMVAWQSLQKQWFDTVQTSSGNFFNVAQESAQVQESWDDPNKN